MMPVAARAVALVLICGVVVHIAPGQEPKAKPPKFEVHEWGVFTAPRNATWLKQDMLAEWSTFPKFFHGFWPKQQLAYRGPVTKPVIYLHSNQTFDMQLEVRFADGRPLIWWPPAELPNLGGWSGKSIGEKKDVAENSFLQFHLRVNDGLENQRDLDKDHWMQALRKVKSAAVRSHNSFTNMRSHYETREQEQFIYYDGVMAVPRAPVVIRTDKGITLKTDSDHDWLDVFVIEHDRDTLKIASSVASKIKSGNRETHVDIVVIENDNMQRKISELKTDLNARLVRAGLHDDESEALMEVWNEGLFERTGLTIFYRVPKETYDQWLPLTCIPAAKDTVRVGLVVHYHLEPELEENVKKWIAELGSQEFRVRQSADNNLRQVGGAAFPFLEEAIQEASPEVRMRCQKILKVKDLESQLEKLMRQHEQQRKNKNAKQ